MDYETADAKKIDITQLTDPTTLAQYHRMWVLRMQKNEEKYQAAYKLWTVMVHNAIQIYGKNSAVHKYIYSRKVPKPPNINAEWEKVLKKLKTFQRKEALRLEKQRQIEEARAKARDYRERRSQAVEVLEENGYEPYEHFRPTSAITFKKKVLIELEDGTIAPRALPEKAGGEREW